MLSFHLFFIQTDEQPCLQASQPDELTIEEQEILEVIDDGDMEDWVKVNIPTLKTLYSLFS